MQSEFRYWSNFGTEVVKRYGEGSEMLVFLGRKGRKMVQTMKNYGGSKILQIRALQYFYYGRALWVPFCPQTYAKVLLKNSRIAAA